MLETDLYLPIKKFLESQGFVVKAEVKSCDVVALRGDEPPLIVELKNGLTLQLIYQALDRLALTDTVYVAVARPKRAVPSPAVKLVKRLGLGLIVVAKSGSVEVVADPVPYTPRKDTKRKTTLLKEFHKRRGDPNTGGSTRTKLMTAYKQDALRCLVFLKMAKSARVVDIRNSTGVDRAAAILRDNHYEWFEKTARGIYQISETGLSAANAHAEDINALN